MRQVNKPYTDMVKWLPCVICGRFPHDENSLNDAAHVRYAEASVGKPITGNSIRPDDCWVLPLCSNCHTRGPKAQHRSGERAWWAEQAIDPINLCQSLYKCWEDGKKSRLSWPRQRDAMIEIIGLGWVHG